jgi:hypothetical protein
MFVQDLIKPSIRLEEDSSVPTLGTLLGEDDPTPTLETILGTPVEPTSQAREPGTEMAAITGPPDSDPDWWKPISEYLHLGAILDDETEPRCLACQAKGYLIHDGELYCHNTIGILQRCIPIEEGKALLLDIHESNCGHHASSRSMVKKSFWQGFYWSIAIDNAARIMRSCRGRQYFVRQIHSLAQGLQTITVTWPFAMWALDVLGPFKKAPGGLTHLLIAIDKFTK